MNDLAERLRGPAGGVALVAFALAFGLPRFLLGVDLRDEGFLAHGAMRVASGQVPNLDFVSLQPPLSFHLLAGVFDLLGPSLRTMRLVGLALHVAVPLGTFVAARRIAGVGPAAIAAAPLVVLGLPIHGFVPFAAWMGVAWAGAAVMLVLRAAASGRAGPAVFAGLASTACLATRHDQGLYLCLSVLAFAAAWSVAGRREDDAGRGRRLLVGWGAGLLGSSLIGLVYWAVRGALPDMFEQLVLFPLSTYAETSAIDWPPMESGQRVGAQLLAALYRLPAVILLASGVRVAVRARRHGFGDEEARVVFWVTLGALFYLQVFTRSDVYHLVITLPPTFVLVAWWLEWGARRVEGRLARVAQDASEADRAARERMLSLWSRMLVLGVVWVAASWAFGQIRPLILHSPAGPRRTLEVTRAGVAVSAREADIIERLVSALRAGSRVDESILALPYQPMYYFLAERRNPTRWLYIWPGDQSPEDHRALVDEARSDPPARVIVHDAARVGEYAPVVMDYVEGHYDAISELGGATVYGPRAED